jgi:hypothetical protein
MLRSWRSQVEHRAKGFVLIVALMRMSRCRHAAQCGYARYHHTSTKMDSCSSVKIYGSSHHDFEILLGKMNILK